MAWRRCLEEGRGPGKEGTRMKGAGIARRQGCEGFCLCCFTGSTLMGKQTEVSSALHVTY